MPTENGQDRARYGARDGNLSGRRDLPASNHSLRGSRSGYPRTQMPPRRHGNTTGAVYPPPAIPLILAVKTHPATFSNGGVGCGPETTEGAVNVRP
jgi:hypothetical protein